MGELGELLVERVLLVKAGSFEEAIERAEKETEEYCNRAYVSVYGQKISLIPLKYADGYEIGEVFSGFKGEGKAVVEIFSATEIIDKKEPVKAILNRKTGAVRENDQEIRFKFIEKESIMENGKTGRVPKSPSKHQNP